MVKVKEDLTNKQFKRLTVIKQIEDYVTSNGKRYAKWLCECECGNKVEVLGNSLKTGNTQSCGCLHKEVSKNIGKENIVFVNPQAYLLNEYDLTGDYGIGYSIDRKNCFLFDKEDFEKIKQYCWTMKNNGEYSYWYTKTTETTLQLHRLIMDCNDINQRVDHINHKVSDNRKQNLRICEHYQNIINCKTYSNNTSGCKGVHWDKSRNKWVARITVNKKNYQLGRFENFEDAVKVRKEAEKIYHKEFAYKEID